MNYHGEALSLLREVHGWFDAEHLPGEGHNCEECGLPWPCPPAKVVAFFDETGQCSRCYRTAAWKADREMLCEPCRARLGISKRDVAALHEQLSFEGVSGD